LKKKVLVLFFFYLYLVFKKLKNVLVLFSCHYTSCIYFKLFIHIGVGHIFYVGSNKLEINADFQQ